MIEVAIDRTHRIGNPKKKKKKVWPLIVKFVRYYERKEVFCKKKYLKGKGISITESLTTFRMKKLKEAREKYGFKNVWTIDGCVMFNRQMISQAYIIINWLKHSGKRIRALVCVILAVICS